MKTTSSRAVPRVRTTARRIGVAALAISLGLAMGPLVRLAHAQASPLSLSIAAQPLGKSLLALGEQASLQIFFSQEIVDGYTAPALAGRLSPDEALTRLLAGTGIAFRRNGRNVSLSRSASVAAAGELSPVTVTGSLLDDPRTEGTGSYTTGLMSTATGLALSPRETPQSVSVITQQQIEDFNLQTLQDALQSSPGISTQSGSAATNDGQIYARGFRLQNLSVDGLALDISNFNAINVTADMTMFDRVEVVRGAAGLMEGAGTPSASVNLVRKRPTPDPLLAVSGSVGNWDTRQVGADISQALNTAGSVRARVAASHREAGSFVDVIKTRNSVGYGIVEMDLRPHTTLAVGASYQENHSRGLDRGLPTFADGSHMGLPRSTYLGTSDDYYDQSTTTYFADLDSRLADRWSLKLSVAHVQGDSDSLYAINYRTADPYVFSQVADGWAYSTEQTSALARVNGRFDLGGREHQLAFGATYRVQDSDGTGTWVEGTQERLIDVRNWRSDVPVNGLQDPDPMRWRNKTTQKGIFAAANAGLTDDLHLLLGGRLNWYEDGTGGWNRGTVSVRTQRKESAYFIPYAGLVLDLDDNHSVYASYTRIFEPQSATDRDGGTLAPITGTNYEAGLKGEYFGGRLNASAAVFLIKQQNRAVDDVDGPNPCPGATSGYCQRASGEVESKGVDLQLSGELSRGWQLGLGYTYAKAEYTKDDSPANIGLRVNTRDPEHQFKLFTSYRLAGELSRWTVYGSVRAQSKTWLTSGTSFRSEQGAYAIVGLGVGYQPTEQLGLRLSVDNVFDKTYYRNVGTAWAGVQDHYGAPRSVLLIARYRY
ncbi:TonB-dependent siderophore receptor [plant metagenome]|uniref:TonB-dependent siderophore receptor n=1 Tax=plant metagenome TaxID=1297885 RepID=A0A484R3X7_9ZZZZ